MFKPLKKVYLASPYSHANHAIEQMRFDMVTRLGAKLQTENKNVAFIAPITQSHTFKQYEPSLGGAFSEWKDIDLTYISICDEVWVLMMNGWKESVGVTAEIQFAEDNNIPVKYLKVGN